VQSLLPEFRDGRRISPRDDEQFECRVARNFRTPQISCAYRDLRSPADRRTGSGVPTGIRTPVLTVKGWCPRPLDDGDADQKKIERKQQTGGARRDRTADLLHAMQALSQLSYGPTWRRGTLPDGNQFVKKLNDLCAPNSPGLGQSSQSLGFSQNGQCGIDGRRHGSATYRQANRLGQLAERDAFRRREAADECMNGRR
jgi:hypothetical protein